MIELIALMAFLAFLAFLAVLAIGAGVWIYFSHQTRNTAATQMAITAVPQAVPCAMGPFYRPGLWHDPTLEATILWQLQAIQRGLLHATRIGCRDLWSYTKTLFSSDSRNRRKDRLNGRASTIGTVEPHTNTNRQDGKEGQKGQESKKCQEFKHCGLDEIMEDEIMDFSVIYFFIFFIINILYK